MAATLTPNAGNLPTPASEKSVYYDADAGSAAHQAHAASPPSRSNDTVTPTSAGAGAVGKQNKNQGADVARNPSVATGALEPRQPAAGGILANRESESKHKDVSFAPATQAHDPSPAYVDDKRNYFANDSKSPILGNEKGGAVGRSSTQSPSQTYSETQKQNNTESPRLAGGGVVSSPQTTNQGPPLRTENDEKRKTSGAFVSGAAITGPDAIPVEDPAQHQRSETAESQISAETKKKINKAEGKDAKRFSKIIKSEGRAQKSNLSATLSELSKLQSIQKQAVKDESKALSAHNKASERSHTRHTKFLDSKAKYEQADAEARARKEALESARVRAQETTAELAVKTKEAEELRLKKMCDDREREARMAQLSQIGKQK